jgi:hypothetical protein
MSCYFLDLFLEGFRGGKVGAQVSFDLTDFVYAPLVPPASKRSR